MENKTVLTQTALRKVGTWQVTCVGDHVLSRVIKGRAKCEVQSGVLQRELSVALVAGGPREGSWVSRMNRRTGAKGDWPSEWREESEWPTCMRGAA